MKKVSKILAAFYIVIISTGILRSQEWSEIKVPNTLTYRLPSDYKEKTINDTETWSAKDSDVIYMCLIVNDVDDYAQSQFLFHFSFYLIYFYLASVNGATPILPANLRSV